jgi:two-component system response regulator
MAHKILIVDDNPDEADITMRVLSKIPEAVNLQTASTGEEALEILLCGDQLPSVILLDLKMPGMGGINTLRRIRADKRLKEIRVIIVTNSSLEKDREESYAAGADWFLHKAFDMDQFGMDIKTSLQHLLLP